MLVDSHCHLNRLPLDQYEGGLDAVIGTAKEKGVTHMLNVCVQISELDQVLAVAQQYETIHASVGQHPTDIIDQEPTAEEVTALAQHEKIVAIGETGLDYFHQDTTVHLQQERFRAHVRAAIAANKPLIVHTRQAREDTLKILQEEGASRVGGVLHCFTESWEMAKAAMNMNFYVSFSGIITFKNAIELQQVVAKMPMDHLLIETDAPYLAPVPHRGKSNQPAWVYYVAEKVAELKSLSLAQVAQKTSQNYFALFNGVSA